MSKQIDTQYIIDLFAGGMSTSNISKKTGYSKTTVIKHLKDSGKYEDRSIVYDTQEIIDRYVNKKQSISTISKDLGISVNAARDHLHRNNIKLRSNSAIPSEDIDKLISDYRSGLLLSDLAVMYNCNPETISRTLKSAGIDINNHIIIGRIDDAEVLEKYNETKSLVDTGDFFNITQQTVKNILRRSGLIGNFRKNQWNKENDQSAIDMYTSGLSLIKIAETFNTTHKTIGNRLRINGIKLRENKKEAKRSTGYKNLSGSHWARIKSGAKNRGLEFSISIEYAYSIYISQKQKCKLSGVDIVLCPLYCDQSNSTASLDRIDSSKGYIEENVQWVHKSVNVMKQAMSDDEFIDWCRKISNNNSN